MADLKSMTVRALRELARKHLGAGYSKLKSKSELLAALDKVIPKAVTDALEPAPAAGATGSAGARKSRRQAAPGPSPAPASKPPSPPASKRAAPPVSNGQVIPSATSTGQAIPSATSTEPESYLVARIAGEQAVRHPEAEASLEAPAPEPRTPPPATGPAANDFDEQLGEFTDGYGSDQVILLPRDPRGLFLYWDLSRETIERAFAWMIGLHTRLRLYADGEIAREQDFSLDSRSWYFHSLQPGRAYRAELLCLSADGEVRRIGPSSNIMRLPSEGPSPIIDDRFIRIPFDVPAGRLAEAMRQAAEARGAPPPFEEASRERLYEMSGGSLRAIGSSEQLAEGAVAPSAQPAESRPGGPLPWSGTIPRRSS